MTIYCFDIDGTLCTNTNGNYHSAEPILDRIEYVNHLYSSGHYIKLFTARGSTTGIDWRPTTIAQLSEWRVSYHELLLGKPHYDLCIDDKSVSDLSFNWDFRNTSTLKRIIHEQTTVSHDVLSDPSFLNAYLKVESLLVTTISQGRSVFLAGNGGSYSDCLHFSAELTGRFLSNRRPLPSYVLSSNPSSITAIANDFGYESVFSRELEALAKPGDLFIALSTSGKSQNILDALITSESLNVNTVLLTGCSHNLPANANPIILSVPSSTTYIIQQFHILVLHSLASILEDIT